MNRQFPSAGKVEGATSMRSSGEAGVCQVLQALIGIVKATVTVYHQHAMSAAVHLSAAMASSEASS